MGIKKSLMVSDDTAELFANFAVCDQADIKWSDSLVQLTNQFLALINENIPFIEDADFFVLSKAVALKPDATLQDAIMAYLVNDNPELIPKFVRLVQSLTNAEQIALTYKCKEYARKLAIQRL